MVRKEVFIFAVTGHPAMFFLGSTTSLFLSKNCSAQERVANQVHSNGEGEQDCPEYWKMWGESVIPCSNA